MGRDLKVSEQFLAPVFETFYRTTGMPGIAAKSDYHFLVNHMEPEDIDHEVTTVLDSILVASQPQPATASSATPGLT